MCPHGMSNHRARRDYSPIIHCSLVCGQVVRAKLCQGVDRGMRSRGGIDMGERELRSRHRQELVVSQLVNATTHLYLMDVSAMLRPHKVITDVR